MIQAKLATLTPREREVIPCRWRLAQQADRWRAWNGGENRQSSSCQNDGKAWGAQRHGPRPSGGEGRYLFCARAIATWVQRCWARGQLDCRQDAQDSAGMTQLSRQIAIVDDDPAVLKALERLLKARSIDARSYPSGRQFLASLAERPPDCLIVDLHMPEMTGLELQRNLARQGLRIPTIVITAHDEAGMRERCEAGGAVAYLTKPVQDTSLLAAIDEACETKR